MSKLHPRHVIITVDESDFGVYRRYKREAIPLLGSVEWAAITAGFAAQPPDAAPRYTGTVMRPALERVSGRPAGDIQAAIECFLKATREPALLEPGEELLPVDAGNFLLEIRNSRLTLQAWDERRNLVRRITGIREETRGRMELSVQRFAKTSGPLYLIDLAGPGSQEWERRGARLVFRERFRTFLARQFSGWKLAELTVEQDLEHSLSPVYPRALLRKGQTGLAVIGAAPDTPDVGGILSFGLIWLDYLRSRQRRLRIEGLALFLPQDAGRATSLRLPFLNPALAQFQIFVYSERDHAARLDPRDYGNVDTVLETCRRPATIAELSRLEGVIAVERIEKPDASVSLRVHGLEFARWSGGELRFGLAQRTRVGAHNIEEVVRLAQELASMREDRASPLHRQNPEAWLESQVRANIETVDASLAGSPLYGQAPAFAGGERGLIDLLAVDRRGRLAVLELKATADLHLPMQALDYWIRVKWHLERDEFANKGYFPGIALRPEPPRLLLVAPALEFHPSTESILRYFSPAVDVMRIGLGMEWRSRFEVMFRLRGGEHPN